MSTSAVMCLPGPATDHEEARVDEMGQPARWGNAAELCAHIWPDREEAMTQVALLRIEGWAVPISPHRTIRDGVRVLATVYHPTTWQSPGELRYRTEET